MTEDEMVGWYHCLNGLEFGLILGVAFIIQTARLSLRIFQAVLVVCLSGHTSYNLCEIFFFFLNTRWVLVAVLCISLLLV